MVNAESNNPRKRKERLKAKGEPDGASAGEGPSSPDAKGKASGAGSPKAKSSRAVGKGKPTKRKARQPQPKSSDSRERGLEAQRKGDQPKSGKPKDARPGKRSEESGIGAGGEAIRPASQNAHDRREASIDQRKMQFRKARRVHGIKVAAVVLALALIVGNVAGFCVIHWFASDDAKSIQGTWRIEGSEASVLITQNTITLTESVSYEYAIDPGGKLLAFKFGGLKGSARYRFSLNHDELCLEDGTFDWIGTLLADIPWTYEAVAQYLAGDGQKSPSFGGDSMVLHRMSDSDAG